jgi:exopolysaccharide production protein ExoZ
MHNPAGKPLLIKNTFAVRENVSRVVGLDWLRGMAALWVLIYHVDVTIQKAKYFGAPSMGILAEVGYRGVELFFVLSGFVMAASTPRNAKSDFAGMGKFVTRRLFRVFPAYLSVFIPLYAIAYWTGIGAPEAEPLGLPLFMNNLLLLPRDDLTSYIPVVSWTLTHELMFYLIFSLIFVRFSVGIWLLAIWSAVCIAAWFFRAEPENFDMPLSILNVYFIVGVFAFRSTQWLSFNPKICTLLSLSLIGAAIVMEENDFSVAFYSSIVMSISYGAGFTLLVLSLWNVKSDRNGPIFNALDSVGRQSYSIYLVHYPIIVVTAIWLSRYDLVYPAITVIIVALAATYFASSVIYRLVEAPFIRLARYLTAATTWNYVKVGA